MATAFAKRALQNLTAFRSTKWYTKDFTTLALRTATDYATRNEINYGLSNLAVGTWANSTLKLSSNEAGECVINGVLKVLPALSDQDVTVSTGAVLDAINGAGTLVGAAYSSAAAIQYVTLLATNSDGDGTQTDTDNSNAKYVAVVGTGDHLTSIEIAAAIAASSGNAANSDHSGCSYVMVAQVLGNTGSPDVVTLNRNNILGA